MSSFLRATLRPLGLLRPRPLVLTRRNHTSAVPIQPTWSTHSLLDPDAVSEPEEPITSSQLHHLLRLSALPLPQSSEEETALLQELQLQLRFVRRVQACDTGGIEPLRSIRDETEASETETSVGLKNLLSALKEEVAVGHYQRPRRIKDRKTDASNAHIWDPLQTATRKSGRYFVVKSSKEAVN